MSLNKLPDTNLSECESVTEKLSPGLSSVAEENLFPVIDVSFRESFNE